MQTPAPPGQPTAEESRHGEDSPSGSLHQTIVEVLHQVELGRLVFRVGLEGGSIGSESSMLLISELLCSTPLR